MRGTCIELGRGQALGLAWPLGVRDGAAGRALGLLDSDSWVSGLDLASPNWVRGPEERAWGFPGSDGQGTPRC